MNNYKTDVQSIQRKEKTMIGAKSSLRIIYPKIRKQSQWQSQLQ